MNELIKLIFEYYGFEKKWEDGNIEFYLNIKERVASYFLISYIDCSGAEEDAESILRKLKELENIYTNKLGNGKHIKREIQELFDDPSEARQLDKNTSAIFPMKFSSIDRLDDFRNLIYSVEESPYYFRRFVLPYTSEQVTELMKILSNNGSKKIVDALSELADSEDDYYDLAEHKNLNSVYELVIRLFSKISFLQYNFKVEQMPLSIEKRIELGMDEKLSKYHEAVIDQESDLERLLLLEDFEMSEKELEDMINSKVRSEI